MGNINAYLRRMDAIRKELNTEINELNGAFIDMKVGRCGSIARQISDLSTEYVGLERSISAYIADTERRSEYRNTP